MLEPGSFRVSEFRKAIPDSVKVQVVLDAIRRGEMWVWDKEISATDLQYDHDPGLLNRPYSLEVGDFIPAQNDPAFIVARLKADHLEKTTGRVAGAERAATTRGSDIGEAKRTRKIKNRQASHHERMMAKRGDPQAISRLLGGAGNKRERPRQKMQSRGFSKQHRPMRSNKVRRNTA